MIKTKIIKIKMIEKGFTLNDLAKILKINTNTISRWINGNNINNIDKFIELCNILEIDIKDLK